MAERSTSGTACTVGVICAHAICYDKRHCAVTNYEVYIQQSVLNFLLGIKGKSQIAILLGTIPLWGTDLWVVSHETGIPLPRKPCRSHCTRRLSAAVCEVRTAVGGGWRASPGIIIAVINSNLRHARFTAHRWPQTAGSRLADAPGAYLLTDESHVTWQSRTTAARRNATRETRVFS